MDNEQLKQQIDIRNKQIQIMIKVLRQELPEDKLQNIMGRIKNETPSIQRQGSKFWKISFSVVKMLIYIKKKIFI